MFDFDLNTIPSLRLSSIQERFSNTLEFILKSFVLRISKPSKSKVFDTFKILHSKLSLLNMFAKFYVFLQIEFSFSST